MATAKLFRRQAATCAAMADQTHDEESRHRCLWLAQTYLRLAELEELPVGQNSDITGEGEEDPRPTLPPTH
jgi:hypothetical protein